jgi:hypothetical protein
MYIMSKTEKTQTSTPRFSVFVRPFIPHDRGGRSEARENKDQSATAIASTHSLQR